MTSSSWFESPMSGSYGSFGFFMGLMGLVGLMGLMGLVGLVGLVGLAVTYCFSYRLTVQGCPFLAPHYLAS